MYTKQEINGMRKELQYILSKDKDYINQIDTMALCHLCFKYDQYNHEYPESSYEGLSLYHFFLSVIGESNELIVWEPWEEELKVEWARGRKAEEKKGGRRMKGLKGAESEMKEVALEEGKVFDDTKRKLIVDIKGKPFSFCCDELLEFTKTHFLYLRIQIRDTKEPTPLNPCLLIEDAQGNRSWYTSCPFCGADIEVDWSKQEKKDAKVVNAE